MTFTSTKHKHPLHLEPKPNTNALTV